MFINETCCFISGPKDNTAQIISISELILIYHLAVVGNISRPYAKTK